mmetsp:Transcript_113666/g.362656  ORF Transcript_113666/g.362656 Transcript_113666/m.362656 type:complete len:147 (-) Transcript_113666:62-502(-)
MVGYARLNRGKIVTESMPSVAEWRWRTFIDSLCLDMPCEFGEGDIGLPGAVQVLEPSSQHITTVDMIRRFGGSTSPSAQWPEEDLDAENDRFTQLEKRLEKAIRRIAPKKRKKGGPSSTQGTGETDGLSSGSKNDDGYASEAGSEM